MAHAQAKSPTTTALAVTSGGGAVTTTSLGNVVTLTASVKAGATALTNGQVNFCDASVTYCTDIHLLGTAQLTSAGVATLEFRPATGSHSYKAVFLGTKSYVTSASSASLLSVTGTIGTLASTTAIAESGSWGNYSLTATVTEIGGTASPTGTVSFLDNSNGNSVLAAIPLGAGAAGVGWISLPGLATPTNTIQAVATGDFNGDGIPDIVAAAGGPSQPLVVWLGNANGTYTAAQPATVSNIYGAAPIVVADFNADGKPDLAALNSDTGTITVLLGNGDGTFTLTASSPQTGSNPSQLAVGDFNGDGIPDLAVTSDSSKAVAILLGNGDGSFTAETTTFAVGNTPFSITAGDFNGDGNLDLAVTDTSDDTVSILLGNGDGTFAPAVSVHCGISNSPIVAADFNGDGKLDLAVGVGATGSNDSVTILGGNGDGTFISPQGSYFGSSRSITAIEVGDFNADGIADLVLADSSTGVATVYLNNGTGSFAATPLTVATQPSSYFVLAAADLNGDGRMDLVTAAGATATVLPYLTEPTETATAATNLSVAGVGQHLVEASYAGDNNYTSSVSRTLPLWGVQPATATALSVTAGGAQVTSVTPGTVVTLTATVSAGGSPVTAGQVNFCDASASYCTDINLLGTVALTSGGTATFKFVPGAGTHSYKAVFLEGGYGLSSTSGVATLAVGPAPPTLYTDTTSIGATGLPGNFSLTATVEGFGGNAPPAGTVSFLDTSFGNTSLATATLGSSTAGVGWRVSQAPALGGNNLTSQVTGDFNGDGIPDLGILWNSDIYTGGTYSVTILFGKGDGTFTVGPTVQPTGLQSLPTMIAGDFNGDGKTDLVILSYNLYSTSYVTALLGNGDGTFAAPQTGVVYNQGAVGGDVLAGTLIATDFNGDGKLDLAVVGDYVNSGGVTILLGNGDGTFTPQAPNLLPNADFGRIASGDFNGDGIPDLVATNGFEDGKSPTIFLGKGDGTFTAAPASFTLDYFPTSIAVGDFNQDGILDLAFADLNGVEIALGQGNGTFKETSASPIQVPSELNSLTVRDFNHDGKPDLAGADSYDGRIVLLLGAGDGTFTATGTNPAVNQNIPTALSIISADFNEDGRPDLAIVTQNIGPLATLLNEPTETATVTVNGIAPVGAGTHNVEASYSGDANYAATVSSTVELSAGLAPLAISPAGGTYSSIQTITISESVPGSTIYYWASGSINTNGFVVYKGPIQLTLGGYVSIQAYATENGYQGSDLIHAAYTLNLPTAPAPVLSLPAGSYPSPQTLTITDSLPGATIYYTTNGTYPTTLSTVYAGPVALSSSENVSAIATVSGYTASKIANAQYIIGSAPASLIYTIAGNGVPGYTGDGGLATVADLNNPAASVRDAAGNLYIADVYNNLVRKVAAISGVISTFAGNGAPGYTGDGGAATSASLSAPVALAFDSAGDLYIADAGNFVVRKVAAATGIITTVAGNGTTGYSGDGGSAANAELSYPSGIAVDPAGNLFIADQSNNRIREVAANTGIISTFAGGSYGYAGDGGPAIAALLSGPGGVATDHSGNLYIADTYNNVVREVTVSNGLIATVAGNHAGNTGASGGYSGDGGPATAAELNFPRAVAVDTAGNLFIADTENTVIREVTPQNGIITTVVGNGQGCVSLGGDGGPATGTALCYPQGLSVDQAGNLYVADSGESRIRLVTVSSKPPTALTATPSFSVAAGSYATPQTVTITDSTPGAAIYVTLGGATPSTAGQIYNGPINVPGDVTIQAIAVAPGYLSGAPETAAYTIKPAPSNVIATVAGSGTLGSLAAAGPATSVNLGLLQNVAVDSTGDIYASDATNNVVWMISAKTGAASIVAGNGAPGYTGDGGPATAAELSGPGGIVVDSAGNLFIADAYNNVVREVAASSGVITTVAGVSGRSGGSGPATSVALSNPVALALDKAGNLYIADSGNAVVRVVAASTGIITTFAGNGKYGSSGDGGPAISASLGYVNALAFDTAGNLFIATPNAGRVRKVAAGSGIITTVAGNGNPYGSSGDGGPATSAEVYPLGLAADTSGNLYIANPPANVREVSASTGVITRFAGNGYPSYSGDGGVATLGGLWQPTGIAFDSAGHLYIADSDNFRIREVTSPNVTAIPVFSVGPGTYASAQTVAMSSSTPGATIYYTTDGTAPTTSSNVYSTPVAISKTETVEAIAVAAGLAQSPVAFALYTIEPTVVAPTVALTPSASSITTAQALTVKVTVSGVSGAATPTGSVKLTTGSYSAQQTLSSGSALFSITAGTLPVGTDTLTATYSPDAAGGAVYMAASQTASVTVSNPIGSATATLSLTPSSSTITDLQNVSIAVSIAGPGGQPEPTGSVSLSISSYNATQAVADGAASLAIPAGTLSAGSNSITINYSGDATYSIASGSTTITVAQVVIASPAPASVTPGNSATETLVLSAGSTYSGTMNFTCKLAASPANAQSPPTCSLNPTSLAITSGGTAKAVLTVQTTASNSADNRNPFGWRMRWVGGSAALSAVIFLGLPYRRRRWQLIIAFLIIAIAAGAGGCGGGNTGGGQPAPPQSTPATTAGSYTFTVTGTDTTNSKITASASVSVTVQ